MLRRIYFLLRIHEISQSDQEQKDSQTAQNEDLDVDTSGLVSFLND